MRRVPLILLVLVVAAAACSGTSSDTSVTPVTNTDAVPGDTAATDTTTAPEASDAAASLGAPCSFVSDTEMSDILGKEVTGQASGDLLCVYMPADVGSGGIELLLQDVTDVGCELIFSVGGFEDEEPVDGVGTYAMFKASGVTQMAVCFDEKVTLTTTLYAEPADPKAALSAVAAAVEQGLS